jgi:K+-sensing histidine kinase KdpD
MLCKEFIGKHGGQIRVESEPGKGSKFYFNIPQKLDKVLTPIGSTSGNNIHDHQDSMS